MLLICSTWLANGAPEASTGWPRPLKLKSNGIALYEAPPLPLTVPGTSPEGPRNGVSQVLCAGKALMRNEAESIVNATHTTRRWAMAVFCAYRKRANVSSCRPRALKAEVLNMRGAMNIDNALTSTTTVTNSISVKPCCCRKRRELHPTASAITKSLPLIANYN
ncbi:hypothetical protein QN397_23850 [Variovorax sp. RTB1]|nr:hypothetical protein [Variovorax sp. RTB1]MEB0114317.1 hypothetical protein [Variovorax sp. RTB1]